MKKPCGAKIFKKICPVRKKAKSKSIKRYKGRNHKNLAPLKFKCHVG
jgi:hypothetical protein